MDAVIAKHYSLWSDLKTSDNLALARQRILDTLVDVAGEAESWSGLASLFELWEWQERQSKFVVNGQRLYEHLGLSWALPLWDEEYLSFWRTVPLEFRFSQKLYRNYLEQYDYCGLFGPTRPIYRSRAMTGWRYYLIHASANVVEALCGEEARESAMKYSRYVGHYSEQYRCYPFPLFLRYASRHRNPTSFFAETCIEELFGNRLRT